MSSVSTIIICTDYQCHMCQLSSSVLTNSAICANNHHLCWLVVSSVQTIIICAHYHHYRSSSSSSVSTSEAFLPRRSSRHPYRRRRPRLIPHRGPAPRGPQEVTSVRCGLSLEGDTALHTPSIAFRHLPPDSARFSYATEGALFISAQLSTDAVSALRKVRVLIRLWKQPSAQART